ncbi:MAG: hypothetical protein ACIAS6_15385 [Phycisphaerales bacterium JB060]
MAQHAEDISKIEDIGERLDALLDALEATSDEVARASISDEPDDERATQPADAPVQPEPEPDAADQVAADDVAQPETADTTATRIDDGLMIEPEPDSPAADVSDIDDAPVGPLDLEAELDEELAALLESGMFEDPVGEMGVDESAAQIDLPEDDDDAQAEAELLAGPELAEERKPNPPSSESELIDELDEQLAALADSQLDGEVVPDDIPSQPQSVEPTSPSGEQPPAGKPAAPEPSTPEAQPTPEVQSQPVRPPGDARPKWKASAQRIVVWVKPAVERAGRGAVVIARRASAPLDGRPELKQLVGWVALVQAFLAACVWIYVVVWHNPPAEPPSVPQPTLETPADS